jgi:hypothetical protein
MWTQDKAIKVEKNEIRLILDRIEVASEIAFRAGKSKQKIVFDEDQRMMLEKHAGDDFPQRYEHLRQFALSEPTALVCVREGIKDHTDEGDDFPHESCLINVIVSDVGMLLVGEVMPQKYAQETYDAKIALYKMAGNRNGAKPWEALRPWDISPEGHIPVHVDWPDHLTAAAVEEGMRRLLQEIAPSLAELPMEWLSVDDKLD